MASKQAGIFKLRAAISAGRESGAGKPVDEVLDRLEAKCRALTLKDAADTKAL